MLVQALQIALAVVVYDLEPPGPHTAQPDPALEPRSVVEFQLQALGHNDVPHADAGVEVVLRFASPSLRAREGGFRGLRSALRAPALRPLFQHREVMIDAPAQPDADHAAVLVVTLDGAGRPTGFLFDLERSAMGPVPGCWLLSAIRRLEPAPTAPPIEKSSI